jgi:hypothetical protein
MIRRSGIHASDPNPNNTLRTNWSLMMIGISQFISEKYPMFGALIKMVNAGFILLHGNVAVPCLRRILKP